MPRPFDLSLYLVTDRHLGPGLIEAVRRACEGGVTLVQLRDPLATTRQLIEQADALLAILHPLGVPLIINDRVDVALASGADGVHLGQDDMPAQKARALLGSDRIIGLSVGTLGEAEASADALPHIDYVGIGPVRATRTKAEAGAAIGIDGFAIVRRGLPVPAVAIGGLTAVDATALIDTGADGLAVVSAICAANDPHLAARDLANAIRTARKFPNSKR